MTAHEKEASRAKLYERLGHIEEKHARFWEQRLRDAGRAPPQRSPSWRARILIWSAKHWGANSVLPRVAFMESAGQDQYAKQAETAGTQMTAEEREHARVLQNLLDQNRGAVGSPVGRIEGRHKSVGGNALRAAVLGANDGLCSNLSLVMAVTGANVSNHSIILTGFAGLFAGACSMALGEWVSVQSSRELAERQIRIERDELESNPEEEREELQALYEAKGLETEAARALSKRFIANPALALDVLAREELGIDPPSWAAHPGWPRVRRCSCSPWAPSCRSCPSSSSPAGRPCWPACLPAAWPSSASARPSRWSPVAPRCSRARASWPSAWAPRG